MTSDPRRWSGSARDETDGIVALMRRELVVPLDDDIANAHLEAMALEFDLSVTSGHANDRPARRLPRAALGTAVIASALTFTGGLAGAGALPAPVQHWLSAATRVFGIDLPDPSAPSVEVPDRNAPDGAATVPVMTPTKTGADHAPPRPLSAARPHGQSPTRNDSDSPSTRPASVGGNGAAPSAPPGNSNAGGNAPNINRGGNDKPPAAEHANNAVNGNAGGNHESAAADHANNAVNGNAGGNHESVAADHANNAVNGNAGANGKSVAADHANNAVTGNPSGNPAATAPGANGSSPKPHPGKPA